MRTSFLIRTVAVCLAMIATFSSVAVAQDAKWNISDLSNEIRNLTETVGPAVVQIYTTSYGALMGDVGQGVAIFGQQQATGSGVILDPNGYIITNNHVVQGAKRVQVRLSPQAIGDQASTSILASGGEIVGAQIVGVDKETDLAVLKIERTDLPFLELGDSEELFQGQLVFAFGSPMGLNNSVSFGVVSTVARQLEKDNPMIYVQSDVAINPGNSGGPLVNGQGKVVGINTLIFTQSGGSEGLSFSAPSNIVQNVYNQIRSTGRVKRGIIGVNAQSINPWMAKALGLDVSWGVILGDVWPNGPAAKAGLRVGDIVLSMDGKPMENARQFNVNMYHKVLDGKVTLQVKRGAGSVDVVVNVVERVDPDYRFFDMITAERNLVRNLGVLCLDLDKDSKQLLPNEPRGQEGVIVAALAADTSLFGEQVLPGDIIYTVNGQQVKGLRSLKKILSEVGYGEPVVLHLERGGQLQYLVLELN